MAIYIMNIFSFRLIFLLYPTVSFCTSDNQLDYHEIVDGYQFTPKSITEVRLNDRRFTPSFHPVIPDLTPQNTLKYVNQTEPVPEPIPERILKGVDRRRQIENTKLWPYCIHGMLEMVFLEDSRFLLFQGSGVLIGPHHVLTAAHNIFNQKTKSFAKKIYFYPALNGKSAEYGLSKVIGVFLYKDWKNCVNASNNIDTQNDIAVLVLADPLGQKYGHAGLVCFDGNKDMEKFAVSVTGYPGDKISTEDGSTMWTMTDKIYTAEANWIRYEIDTTPGQSGGGIWIDSMHQIYIVAVHVLGDSKYNWGVRISHAKFYEILSIISKTAQVKKTYCYLSTDPAQQHDYEKIEKKAIAGDINAQFQLGTGYLLGIHMQPDCEQAFYWLEKAAQQAHVLAQFHLGHMYQHAKYVSKNYVKAIEWYTKAANRGNIEAQNNLGSIYEQGDTEILKDENKAVYWYNKAAEQNDGFAQFKIGSMCEKGYGEILPDKKQAIIWYEKAISHHSNEAQLALAALYVDSDEYEKAIPLLYECAEKFSNAQAQFMIGEIYLCGLGGTPRNIQIAFEWFTKAADQEMVEAQFALCQFYLNGEKRDENKTIELCRKLAEAGYWRAQIMLGKLYEKGYGRLNKDIAQAIDWYTKAAEKNHPEAQFECGRVFAKSSGERK